MFEPMELTNDAVIKVIGVGGGGGNAVEHMVRERIEGVEFFAVNTDAQALRKTAVGQTIQIGSGITKGLGAGANPEVGRNAAATMPELVHGNGRHNDHDCYHPAGFFTAFHRYKFLILKRFAE